MRFNWCKISTALILLVSIIALTGGGVTADSYILGVYGNANMDDTIDDSDITYVQDIIDGKKTASEFADANYDGTVDDRDIVYINEIIAGTSKSITISDFDKKIKTITLPVTRIIPTYNYEAWAVQALGAKDKVVAIDQSVKEKEGLLFEDLVNLPSVGSWENYDIESIIDRKSVV